MAKIVDKDRNERRRKLALEEVEASGLVIQSGGTSTMVIAVMDDGQGSFARFMSPGLSSEEKRALVRLMRRTLDDLMTGG